MSTYAGFTAQFSISSAESAPVATLGVGTTGIQITGTWDGTIIFEATTDGINWFEVNAFDVTSVAAGATTTATDNGAWAIASAPYTQVRARMSSYVSGTAVVTLVNSLASRMALVG